MITVYDCVDLLPDGSIEYSKAEKPDLLSSENSEEALPIGEVKFSKVILKRGDDLSALPSHIVDYCRQVWS
jgi:hypothetical protein